MSDKPPLLKIENLSVNFSTKTGLLPAVQEFSLFVTPGETLGILGESGSGKTVSMLAVMRLLPSPPSVIHADTITFQEKNLLTMSQSELRQIRGNTIAMIFQEPMTALNPYMTIEEQLIETIFAHRKCNQASAKHRVLEVLNQVGISDAQNRLKNYPHELSGGMRQRIIIAMSLLLYPTLLIADEPTTALDVTVEAQILELMASLRQKYNMSIIWITHNMGIIAEFCDRVAVMYLGRLLEIAPTVSFFTTPRHPYSEFLISSHPKKYKPKQPLGIKPAPTSQSNIQILSCPFADRCPYVKPDCLTDKPKLAQVSTAHFSACFRVQRGEI